MDQGVFTSLHSPQRLAALQQSQLLSPAFTAVHQQVLRLLARVLDVPIALLLVLDADQERIVSCVGLREHWSAPSLPLEASFSKLVLSVEPFLVADTLSDPLTLAHPTTRQLGLGAIAGVALRSTDEHFLGTLLVADEQHRVWTADHVIRLQEFAKLIQLENTAYHQLSQQTQYSTQIRLKAQLVDHVEQAVVATNAEGNITYWNPFAEKLYGWSAHEVLGHPIIDIIPMPIPKERMLTSIGRLAKGEHNRAEIELRRRDGTLFPAMVAVAPVREDDGTIVGIVGVSVDISDRKRMEAELRERERRYRTISQITSDYVYSMEIHPDGSMRSLWATQAFVRITGYTREEAQDIGGWQGLIHPDDMPSAFERKELLMQGQADVRDLRIVTKQGQIRWIRDYAAPEWDEQHQRIVGIIGAAQDITDRKQAEQALRDAEARYRSLVERIPAITYITSLGESHRTLYISPQVENILGYPISDWLTDRDLWTEQVHPEDRERMYQLIQDASLHHKPFKAEYRMIGRDGRVHWFRDESVLVQTQGQGRSVLQGVAFEITEQKRAEADRLAFERTLLESQKRESLGVLAGGVAHDFNNLLLVILGNAALAQLDVSEQSPTHATITEIVHAAERAAHLVQQLLAYTGKGRLLVQPLNLGVLVQDMQTLLRSSLPNHVQLHINLHGKVPLVEADESQIQQVVTNLVLNAAEAINEQQGHITIAIQAVEGDELSEIMHWHPSAPSGSYVVLTVADTGHGMDQATQERMFEPFFSTKFTGRGLGLAAVQGIVQGHNGVIGVQSAPQAGTTFVICLPAYSTD